MENSNDIYEYFKKFVNDFLIRKVGGKLNADDFDDEKYESISLHLETLLPSLPLTEAMRIQEYFNDLLTYHVTDNLGNAIVPNRPQSPMPTFSENDVQIVHSMTPSSQIQIPEILGGSSSETNVEQHTPLDSHIERRKTVPIMQSTPLFAPQAIGAVTNDFMNQQENDFVDDIISQINLSPILQIPSHLLPSVRNESTETPAGTSSAQPVESTAVAAQNAIRPKKMQKSNTPRTSHKRLPVNELVVRQPKKKNKKLKFDSICSLASKQRTDEEIKEVEESFLYFQQITDKTRNIIKRLINNIVIAEGERGHISIERVKSLSNIIRAHASQRQTLIEQPNQGTWSNILHTPSTPNGLLRTSQMQPITPLQSDISIQFSSVEMDPTSSVPIRSVTRQQPLMTIPERDSVLPVPLTPPIEEISLNNSSICIPRHQENSSEIPSDIRLVTEQDSYSRDNQERTAIDERQDISNPRIEDLAAIQLPLNELRQSPLRVVPEHIETIDEQPQAEDAVVLLDLQAAQLPPNNVTVQAEVPDEPTLMSWFDILRPRQNIVYPSVDREKRKYRKRKRQTENDRREHHVQTRQLQDLPEIPESPPRNNLPAILDDFTEQITQNEVSNHSGGIESEFNSYFNLIKEAGKSADYRTCEHFDPYLFSESEDFEMYTYIFKRMIKEDYVAMDTLYEKGTTRLEAAKGFKLILELKTMDLIEIDAVDTRIMGFKFKPINIDST